MNKIWFILIGEKREGPYSFEDLKHDSRVTPDTLIWKEGFSEWKKIRDVPELKNLFKDNPEQTEPEENEQEGFKKRPVQDELVLDFGQEPPFLLWVLIALIALMYVFIRLSTR